MYFCIGPMSKNIVDAVLEYSRIYKTSFTFIPSRRQIDYQSGYVNHWTTKSFCEYVKAAGVPLISIQRDHGGPGQGDINDDGLESLREDSNYMDSIHIDPWKKYPIYEEALEQTIKLLEICYSLNPSLTYEIGTEEGIRPLSTEMIERFITDLQMRLDPAIFLKIKFVVIQCGTQLLEKENIGNFDEQKLRTMLALVKSYVLLAKEHNGDWVPQEIINQKRDLGLQYINIAPEFGEIETRVLLQYIRSNTEDFLKFYKLCLESNRWKKWVSSDFSPEENKEKLILISGHYVFSHPEFLEIKSKYIGVDSAIKDAITQKLHELCNIYTVRKACIFCENSAVENIFREDKRIAISNSLFQTKSDGYFIPYNVQHCKLCGGYQTAYLGDLELIYSNNHIDNFGTLKSRMHDFFGDFICKNKKIINSVEIGACHDYLSRFILSKSPKNNVHIIDPYFTGNTTGLTLQSTYLENTDLEKLPVNTLIMSSIFEHFYNPLQILKKFQNAANIQYIYLNHPDMEYAIKNDIYINLTTEHTFYLEKDFLVALFEQHNFTLTNQDSFEHHTLCLEFTRSHAPRKLTNISNKTSFKDVKNYYMRIDQKIKNMNTFMEENPQFDFYVWPASMHLTPLFTQGLHTQKLKGLLDNSPNKIGKYFYGYNLQCFSFTEVVNRKDPNICIFLGGSPNYRKELMLSNKSCRFYEI